MGTVRCAKLVAHSPSNYVMRRLDPHIQLLVRSPAQEGCPDHFRA